MSTSLADPRGAPERPSLADVCGKPIKADIAPQVPATNLRVVADEARRRTMKLESAALDLGLHPARVSHKFSDGTLTLKEIEKLGPTYAAELGRLLVEHYAALSTPQARIRQKVRELRAIADEVEQATELIA